MVIECGFFNSVNRDRLYKAEEMTRPYELLISNGVFATPEGTPSNFLQVYASDGMNVVVRPGRGVFMGKWLINTDDLVLNLDASEVVLNRIDSIVVRIDAREEVRTGTIVVKKGTAASSPTAPGLTRTETIEEYRLADITVNAGVTSIVQANIRDMRGSADCGWITSLIQQVDTSTLYDQWKDAFDTWFAELHETVATQTLIRTFTSYYTTVEQDETVIPVNITQFNNELDILQVFINGLMLIKDLDYTVDSNPADSITLTKPVDAGTPVSFVVYKSVDGSEAETVLGQVFTLQNLHEITKITSDTGSTKLSAMSGEDTLAKFNAAGKGFHTMYIQAGATNVPVSGAYRALGHLTGDGVGWLMAIQANGSVYVNYMNGGNWTGWRTLYATAPTPLYISANGVFPNNDATVTPTKKLSECAHGWELTFSGYDDVNKAPRTVYNQTVHIPKKAPSGADWNGESVIFNLIGAYADSTDTITTCIKAFQVYNDRIVSTSFNATGGSRALVLRTIYEY